jgi:hypothetical protein
MEDVQGAFVHGCKGPFGTGTFVQVEGEATREIVFAANDLHRAKQAIQLGSGVCPESITGL